MIIEFERHLDKYLQLFLVQLLYNYDISVSVTKSLDFVSPMQSVPFLFQNIFFYENSFEDNLYDIIIHFIKVDKNFNISLISLLTNGFGGRFI